MKTPKNYFHDKIILLLLSVNMFIAVLGSLYVMLRVNFGEPYILQYRGDYARNSFIRGDASDFWQFVIFAFLTVFLHWGISLIMYKHQRYFAYTFLFIGFVLLVFNLVVSNALIGSPL
jgi:hypothetical protein